jgi:hypothetical protein
VASISSGNLTAEGHCIAATGRGDARRFSSLKKCVIMEHHLRWPGTRLLRRFLGIARSAGWRAAVAKTWRKIGSTSRLWSAPLMAFWPFSVWAGHRRYSQLDPYAVWMSFNSRAPVHRKRLRAAIDRLPSRPVFSVLMPVYNTPPDLLSQAIASVVGQSYESWELIVVDDGSTTQKHHAELQGWSRRDPRVKPHFRSRNGNISIATNAAAALAEGDYLVFLDHDDLLHPDALAHLALHVVADPEADLIYTDDDKITADGRRHSPQFKPDWSPELLLSFCYVGHLKAVRTRLFRDVGGMRAGYEGSQDHDFFLRASEQARRVGHIPQVLYHWRVHPGSTAADGRVKPLSFEAGRLALKEAFRRRGVSCEVCRGTAREALELTESNHIPKLQSLRDRLSSGIGPTVRSRASSPRAYQALRRRSRISCGHVQECCG